MSFAGVLSAAGQHLFGHGLGQAIAAINLFDHVYQIRNATGIGVFSPQYGPRRAVFAGLRIPLPVN
jgi:hypothetical protein